MDSENLYPYSSDVEHTTASVPAQNGPNVLRIIFIYTTPVIVFSGIMGNVVSITVFCEKRLRHLSSTVYAQAVLVSDTGFLVSLFIVWLESFDIQITKQDGLCQTYVYLSYVCSFLSVWYVVCITVENYITICHPTHISTYCTSFRAKAVVAGLSVGALALFAVYIPLTRPQQIRSENITRCHTDWRHYDLQRGLSYMDTVATIVLPLVAVVVMLTLIVSSVLRSMHRKKKRTVKQKQGHNISSMPQVRVARLLFAISVTFLVLNMPSHGIRLFYLFFSEHNNGIEFYLHVFLNISYVSFAIKFFLFLIFSANFRNILWRTFGLVNVKKKKCPTETAMTTV